ncbi:hypothetical protein M9H77_18688 [Catharanthus roseus]|uniref:Uncharacterized protein n=1 Tax=Catharanthus roseus TaxID=4058 RepID=A0ACC0B861_CATRO|nr:hypothetical protein M9H77_18688 [Catharanthus roseus]
MIHNQRNVELNKKILFKNRKTITEFFYIMFIILMVEKYSTCKVMVLSIDMNNDFYYKSFVVCYRKLVEIESITAQKMYMLKVLASDETGSTWFILSDKEVEKVIGHDIETDV